jgi:hypothetical protein
MIIVLIGFASERSTLKSVSFGLQRRSHQYDEPTPRFRGRNIVVTPEPAVLFDNNSLSTLTSCPWIGPAFRILANRKVVFFQNTHIV